MGVGLLDWETAKQSEKALLYKSALSLKKRLHLDWLDVWERAFGDFNSVGDGYENNFRKGKINGQKSREIFEWITREDRGLADRLEEDIFASRDSALGPISPARHRWNDFLQEHGRFDDVEAYPQTVNKSLVTISRREPLSKQRFKLREEFYVELTLPFDGYCAALQGFDGFWYSLPLLDELPYVPVSAGNQKLPLDGNEEDADTFREDTDRGVHKFLFVSATEQKRLEPFNSFSAGKPIDFDLLSHLARDLKTGQPGSWKVTRLNLMIG